MKENLSIVLLAITPQGLQHALQLARDANLAVWCGSDAISEAEYGKLSGVNLSRFTYPLYGEPAGVLQDALDTIAEHHPGDVVWVEHVASIR